MLNAAKQLGAPAPRVRSVAVFSHVACRRAPTRPQQPPDYHDSTCMGALGSIWGWVGRSAGDTSVCGATLVPAALGIEAGPTSGVAPVSQALSSRRALPHGRVRTQALRQRVRAPAHVPGSQEGPGRCDLCSSPSAAVRSARAHHLATDTCTCAQRNPAELRCGPIIQSSHCRLDPSAARRSTRIEDDADRTLAQKLSARTHGRTLRHHCRLTPPARTSAALQIWQAGLAAALVEKGFAAP